MQCYVVLKIFRILHNVRYYYQQDVFVTFSIDFCCMEFLRKQHHSICTCKKTYSIQIVGSQDEKYWSWGIFRDMDLIYFCTSIKKFREIQESKSISRIFPIL